LPAQVVIQTGIGKPDDALRGKWYLDTRDSILYSRPTKYWHEKDRDKVLNYIVCRGIVAVQFADEWNVYADNGKYVSFAEEFECLEGIARVQWTVTNNFYIDTFYVGWSKIPDYRFSPARPRVPDTLGGIPAYCASAYTKSSPQSYGPEVHGWGMLGYNGLWLVEPQFDAPFFFYKGFAEVLYYGKKRKINEKGEFVE
jgi:hypothetical protein